MKLGTCCMGRCCGRLPWICWMRLCGRPEVSSPAIWRDTEHQSACLSFVRMHWLFERGGPLIPRHLCSTRAQVQKLCPTALPRPVTVHTDMYSSLRYTPWSVNPALCAHPAVIACHCYTHSHRDSSPSYLDPDCRHSATHAESPLSMLPCCVSTTVLLIAGCQAAKRTPYCQ